jgi:hypothetical protein
MLIRKPSSLLATLVRPCAGSKEQWVDEHIAADAIKWGRNGRKMQ